MSLEHEKKIYQYKFLVRQLSCRVTFQVFRVLPTIFCQTLGPAEQVVYNGQQSSPKWAVH